MYTATFGLPLTRVTSPQVVDAQELTPISHFDAAPCVIVVAAFFGNVRLIDNRVLPL